MSIASQIVDDLLEGKVGDWFADKWNDVKVATGIGQDSFGLGKAEKGWKPNYGAQLPSRKKPVQRRPAAPPQQPGEKVWDITP